MAFGSVDTKSHKITQNHLKPHKIAPKLHMSYIQPRTITRHQHEIERDYTKSHEIPTNQSKITQQRSRPRVPTARAASGKLRAVMCLCSLSCGDVNNNNYYYYYCLYTTSTETITTATTMSTTLFLVYSCVGYRIKISIDMYIFPNPIYYPRPCFLSSYSSRNSDPG